jgi:P-type Ca2+ transporter type 2C
MVKIVCPCRKKTAALPASHVNPSSLLDIADKDPMRFKPLYDAALSLKSKAYVISQVAYSTFLRVNQAFWEMMGVESALLKLQNAKLSDIATVLAPYALTYGFFSAQEQYLSEKPHFEGIKFLSSLCFMGYLFSYKITEKHEQTVCVKVILSACTLFTFISLHKTFYDTASLYSDRVLSSFERENYITHESRDNFNILLSLIASFALLPKLVLLYEKFIRSQKEKLEQRFGLKTQNSALAKLTSGATKEASLILNIYDHFTEKLHDPSRLFQYFIVSMNVLRDTQAIDPALGQILPKKGLSYTLNKTRNCWLLLIDSIAKAKADLEMRSIQLTHDTAINSETYNVIRYGKVLPNVKRFELQVGDLISLDQAIDKTTDPTSGHIREKAKLCGYILALKKEDKDRNIAISLIELNGENHPVIIKPSTDIKTKKDCHPIDLFCIPQAAAILPGTEFISFDTEKHEAKASGLYLQIAKPQGVKEAVSIKTPLSTRNIKQLKDRLIYQTLFLSVISALPLMNFKMMPLSVRKFIQFYGTEFIDKFTQVFSETQQMIPLVSEMALEMVNSSLIKPLNQHLSCKISVNQALLISDLFEALSQKSVRILSDKTGTVTETFMRVKNLIPSGSMQELALAFATTFSDQKTEAEENEIKKYLETSHNIVIEADPNGPYGFFEKHISFDEGLRLSFNTKRLGLFTEFGGQFTLREREDLPPTLVFCGIPKERSGDDLFFEGSTLMAHYKGYEAHQVEMAHTRMDSLTRDWCIAEVELTSEDHTALLEALACKHLHVMKALFQKLAKDFQFLGIFQIDNPIKKEAASTIKAWQKASIDFTLITGDTKNAAKMIAYKLYGSSLDHVIKASLWPLLPKQEDYSSYSVIFTELSEASLSIYEQILQLGSKKPWIIFAQMKDADKKRIADHAKAKNAFVVASGDGCNDIMMFNSSHLAIASSQSDGSFARGVEEVSSISDIQIKELMQNKDASLYELFDIHLGKDSVFLKHFARFANTQPKVITSLLGKSLKSMAIPRLLGKYTREIPGQFGMLLAYDAAFLGSVYHKVLECAHVPLIKEPIHKSKLPYAVLITAVALAALESLHCYVSYDRQIVSMPILAINLGISFGCLSLFLAPPGFKKEDALA